jgi:Raf kinase inhibitor-like YbhB/YbcL family protein
MTRMQMICAAAACALAIGGAAGAQPMGTRQEMLTYTMEPAKGGAKLTVTSPAFKQGGAIPLANSAYGQNQMPGLSWTAGPAGTKSYLVIMEDPDAPTPKPYLHWIAANIPVTTTTLPAAMVGLPGIIQATARTGMNQYFGPRPPRGVDNYNFQVFALDTTITGQDGITLADVQAQMKGHVLASGVLVGTYAAPPPAAPAAAPATK